MSSLYPWHADAWERAWAALDRGAHALLIAGASGLGKGAFASTLAASRLCHRRDPKRHACGKCESCHWLSAGTHPDLALVEPVVDDEGEASRSSAVTGVRSKPISVDQIRSMTESLGLTAHRDAGKVVVVRPADALNVAASNALLKSLEEPPPDVLFLLVADRPALLLPTVRSRCQLVSIRLRDRSAAASWLQSQDIPQPELSLALTGGAPLQAVAVASDPSWQRRPDLLRALLDVDADALRIAERYRELPPALVLGWLQKMTYDLSAALLNGPVRYNVDLRTEIEARARRADAVRITRLHRKLVSTQRIANHPLNPRLFLEQMFVDCVSALTANAS